MVTGGRMPPFNLGTENRGGAMVPRSTTPSPPSGQNIVQARNAKKHALEEFARQNNLKPENVKKGYKKFQQFDRYVKITITKNSIKNSIFNH